MIAVRIIYVFVLLTTGATFGVAILARLRGFSGGPVFAIIAAVLAAAFAAWQLISQ